MIDCIYRFTIYFIPISADLAPKYRDTLLPAFLSGCRDKDPFVRASSLSNLGEVCKVLRYSLGNVLQEVNR